jgi:hypothetical protein
MSKESFLEKNYKEEYNYIIEYCKINNIHNIPMKEKVYLVLNNLIKVPLCKNINCNNIVKFKNTTLGYLSYCSKKCISSDPDIKKRKQDKSYISYGTKTPAESKEIKNKIINTNKLKYGGNSPMSNIDIQEKAKKTLLINYGVDNPNKSEFIIKKRIESFKLSSYKETYRNTSNERYGVDHPWMVKDIHDKTIDFFYKSYKKRIIDKIDNNFEFIKFDKANKNILEFNCHTCNTNFNILSYQFYYRVNNKISICTNCFPISENSSISQIELFNFIKENYNGNILQNNKNIINPYEIDIYLPDLKIGFEFNGVFWHSSKFKDNSYHFKKYNTSIESGIKLYTIWEDDWNIKRDICKSFILNKLSMTKNRLFARRCEVKEVSYNISKDFLDENHLQGDCKSSKRIGLYYNNDLVSIMTFSKLRLPVGGENKKNVYELTRFCNKINYNIVGGASKLLNFFYNKYNPVEIQTYSDNLISNGDLYEKLGFTYIHTSKPGYWYNVDNIRSHRFNWRKQKLVSMGYDSNKSEEEIMLELGHFRIYNAGNKKWIKSY